MDIRQFGQSLKAKYPEYGDMSDEEVGEKAIARYPQYRDMVQAESRPGFLKSVYNLAVRPTVQGARGYGELLGAAGLTLGSLATQNVKPELSTKMAEKAYDIRKRTGMEGSFDRGKGILDTITNFSPERGGYKTLGVGGLKTAGGVSAAMNVLLPFKAGVQGLATSGVSGLVGGVSREVGKEAVRNLLVNSGLYGTGEAAKAIRTGDNVGEAFVRGATGEGTVGPVEGITGSEDLGRTADIVLSVGLPLVLGKQIDRVTNKIVNAPVAFVRQVKDGATSSKVASSIKQKTGDARYNVGKDDVLGYLNPTKRMMKEARERGIDIADTVIARNLNDTPDINLATVRAQEKAAREELVRLAQEKAGSVPPKAGGEIGRNLVSKDIYQDIADELKLKSRSAAERSALDRWVKDNARDMDIVEALSEKKVSGRSGFTEGGDIKQQAIAKADAMLAMRLKNEIVTNIDGQPSGGTADLLLRSQEESLLLQDVFENILDSKKGTTLEQTIGRIFNPITFARHTLGKGSEWLAKKLLKSENIGVPFAGQSKTGASNTNQVLRTISGSSNDNLK